MNAGDIRDAGMMWRARGDNELGLLSFKMKPGRTTNSVQY